MTGQPVRIVSHTDAESVMSPAGAELAIKAVVFDIDGVLLDSKLANAAYYRNLLSTYGFPPVTDDVLAYGHSHTLRESIAFLTKASAETVDTIFEAVRDLSGYPYELVCQPDGCVEALEALRREYALGVMSSRIVEGIRQYLDLTRTHDLFDAIVGYEDTAAHKPEAEPLLLACERLGVVPEATVYVGDAPGDLACARAAGAHFIAFGDAVPDAEHAVSRFGHLAGVINRLDHA